MPRYYKPRLSQKVVLEYLKSIYPEWRDFEHIFDELPIVNVEAINLACILQKLVDKGLIEYDAPENTTKDFYQYWRYKE